LVFAGMKKFQVHFTGSRHSRESALTTVSAEHPDEAAAIVARQINKAATVVCHEGGRFVPSLHRSERLATHEFTLTEVPS
jgi:hypothetical protein